MTDASRHTMVCRVLCPQDADAHGELATASLCIRMSAAGGCRQDRPSTHDLVRSRLGRGAGTTRSPLQSVGFWRGRLRIRVEVRVRFCLVSNRPARLIGVDEGHVLVTRTELLQASLVQPRLGVDCHCGSSTDD